ncbi:MAG: tRNA (guanosine(37)-N1)-methyltransferase TrmD [bacterium]|nr:tRNA (guanosine(37)-N1)-methyltransferase TrmD [bacterium]
MTSFHIITIFPEALEGYFDSSILKRARESKLIKIKFHNPRDFAKDKHRTTDDKPFGGGPGMVMKVEPIVKTIESILKAKRSLNPKNTKIIFFSPAGKQFTQKLAKNFAKKYDNLILVCGRYEGIDARVEKVIKNLKFKIENLSVGPFVLTGGELPAAIIIDAVSRHIPGVLGKKESLEDERGIGIPVYTRPEVFEYPPPRRGKKSKKYRVPKTLMTGHHKKIEEWRKNRAK